MEFPSILFLCMIIGDHASRLLANTVVLTAFAQNLSSTDLAHRIVRVVYFPVLEKQDEYVTVNFSLLA